ncbi:Periplasmic chaperone for outer membrane protein Skp [uncultured Sporomusa sp.]|uniref:Periplasmic chaperone for outer membrane protein Skp n=1 Tax=uncultured Sporomusa sp. TaxID=307249 RepID=A0A212LMI0_9FIRM|nr:OmpH family outer membrane protein [uncultured Sporomusa sp.]SCM78720.1 Periplasmic chaperone for outer membrane protein Skp [uncultured Sporomusa sp.]
MKQLTRSLLLLIAVCFLGGMLAPAGALAAKAKAEPEQTVGYVNRQQIFSSYPGIQDILKQIQALREAAQQDYDTRSKDLPDAERQAINDTIAREEARKEDLLMKPVGDKIEASIKAVAEEKGLTVIIDAATVVYGGIDITADVIAKLKQ